MKAIESVYILGAGGLGAVYGSTIHRARPGACAFLATGERRRRLGNEGVIVNDTPYRLPVLDPEDAAAPDLVLVAVKYHHLDESIEMLRRVVGRNTLILSLLNGIDSEEILAAHFGAARVVHGLCLGIDAVRHGNRVSFTNYGVIYFGRLHNDPPAAEIVAIQRLFTECGIAWETPVDMLRSLWWKFMINVGINQVSAVLGLPYRGFQSNPHARALMDAAMREVIALAAARRINLDEDDIARWYEVIERLSPEGKTSMHQDVEQGRKTEVEMLAGKVNEIGERAGIATPVNRVLFDLLRAREFEYPA